MVNKIIAIHSSLRSVKLQVMNKIIDEGNNCFAIGVSSLATALSATRCRA